MNLTINNVEVRSNEKGLYSINDLHKAAGGDDLRKPLYFFRNHKVKEFILELEKETQAHLLVMKQPGRNGGTWVDELIVYKYAAWVNPEFDVRVFKTFQALSKGDHDKAQAVMSNDKEQLDIIAKRDKILASKIPSGKKADKLAILEKRWLEIGSSAGKSLSIRRGQSFKFVEAQNLILNDIQTSFEF